MGFICALVCAAGCDEAGTPEAADAMTVDATAAGDAGGDGEGGAGGRPDLARRL